MTDTLQRQDGRDLRAASDAELIRQTVLYGRKALGLRLSPSGIDRQWAFAPLRRDVEAELAEARDEGKLSVWLTGLEPDAPGYQALRAARIRYQAIAAAGGWDVLPAAPVLQRGDRHAAVDALRRRLSAEDPTVDEGLELPVAGEADVFDAALGAALKRVQARYGLEPDGRLGPETRRALDAPVTDRLGQIDANLERLRWLPRPTPADRIELNIARQEALLYRGGELVLSMRAIVGKPSTKTPMFASQVDAIVLNPSWHVPASIARGELLPQERRAPGTLARRGFVREGGGLRQLPGPGNALGRLKFEMASAFDVYLHDTSTPSLFARAPRLFSHGCMRLERPRELALGLLSDQGWTAETLDKAIDAGATRRVVISRPVTVLVVYRTAGVDADGGVWFAADPYGWDRKLIAALQRAEPS